MLLYAELANSDLGQLVDEAPQSLRWLLAHMTSETARHAGHVDILRELIDGTTGRWPGHAVSGGVGLGRYCSPGVLR